MAMAQAVCLSALPAAPSLADNARHAANDALFETPRSNVENAATLEFTAEIDHAGLAGELGQEMPPSRVPVFSHPALEAASMRLDPRIGADLPSRKGL
jgi:hypothetical protein